MFQSSDGIWGPFSRGSKMSSNPPDKLCGCLGDLQGETLDAAQVVDISLFSLTFLNSISITQIFETIRNINKANSLLNHF